MNGLVDKKEGKLLRHLFNFKTVAVEEFIVKEKFVEGQTVDGVTFCSALSDNFKENFLEKTEEDVKSVELKVHELLIKARHLPSENKPGIIPELDDRHETKLAQFHQLLSYKQQKKDFSSVVPVVAYIRDKNNELRVVRAIWYVGEWYGKGWFVSAYSYSVEAQIELYAGSQVVSC